MTTVFLRFPDRASALTAFRVVAGLDAETTDDVPDHVAVGGHRIDIAILGEVVATESGEPRSGWHVNLRLPPDAVLPAALTAVEVWPVHPARVFAD